jgi:hypothetical protein
LGEKISGLAAQHGFVVSLISGISTNFAPKHPSYCEELMDTGMVLVALVVTGVVGCVTTVAILFGTIKIRGDKESFNLEAASQEKPKPNRKSTRNVSTKS